MKKMNHYEIQVLDSPSNEDKRLVKLIYYDYFENPISLAYVFTNEAKDEVVSNLDEYKDILLNVIKDSIEIGD